MPHIRSSACQVAIIRQPPGSWSGGRLPSPPRLGCERVLELGLPPQTSDAQCDPFTDSRLPGLPGPQYDSLRYGQCRRPRARRAVKGRAWPLPRCAFRRTAIAAAHVTNASCPTHRKPSAPEGMAMVGRALCRVGLLALHLQAYSPHPADELAHHRDLRGVGVLARVLQRVVFPLQPRVGL